MKIELENEDKQQIITAVIDTLTNTERMSFTYSRNKSKIEDIMETEVKKRVREIMVEVLDDSEFKEQIYELGVNALKKKFKNMSLSEVLD